MFRVSRDCREGKGNLAVLGSSERKAEKKTSTKSESKACICVQTKKLSSYYIKTRESNHFGLLRFIVSQVELLVCCGLLRGW